MKYTKHKIMLIRREEGGRHLGKKRVLGVETRGNREGRTVYSDSFLPHHSNPFLFYPI